MCVLWVYVIIQHTVNSKWFQISTSWTRKFPEDPLPSICWESFWMILNMVEFSNYDPIFLMSYISWPPNFTYLHYLSRETTGHFLNGFSVLNVFFTNVHMYCDAIRNSRKVYSFGSVNSSGLVCKGYQYCPTFYSNSRRAVISSCRDTCHCLFFRKYKSMSFILSGVVLDKP